MINSNKDVLQLRVKDKNNEGDMEISDVCENLFSALKTFIDVVKMCIWVPGTPFISCVIWKTITHTFNLLLSSSEKVEQHLPHKGKNNMSSLVHAPGDVFNKWSVLVLPSFKNAGILEKDSIIT